MENSSFLSDKENDIEKTINQMEQKSFCFN